MTEAPGPAAAPAGQQEAVAAALRAAGCVFAEDEAELLMSVAATPAELAAMVGKRAAGLPLEQVVGWAEFCGLRIAVDPGVFVPRRRSEFLVALAVAAAGEVRLPAGGRPRPAAERGGVLTIADLCCGTGAIGLAIATAAGPAQLYAADIAPAAVSCARRNVSRVGGQVFQGDLFDALPPRLRGRIDVLAVNAPYVPTGEIRFLPPEARLHEPPVALDGGADGVDVQRRVSASAAEWLSAEGRLLVETSDRQAPLTIAAMTAGGLTAAAISDGELGSTIVIGSPQRPAAG